MSRHTPVARRIPEDYMVKTSVSHVPRLRAVWRRKIEALTISAVAALAAVGILRRDTQVAPAAVSAVLAREVKSVASVARPFDRSPTYARANAAGSSGSQVDLPNIAHPRVDSWIKRFTTDQRGSFATYLSRMTRYESMISSKLAARNMPQSLIYLAMIESGFNPTAKSPVKASGLWQFMGPTAKQYGLTVNRKLDERNNPARSTDAALKYLASLHNRLGSWYLAAAAYNSGEGTVTRALKKETGRTRGTDADYYRIASRLPKETRDYVPKMIAAARIGSDPTRYGFVD
jgi:soluble lytic murein transglycosylase-like protein